MPSNAPQFQYDNIPASEDEYYSEPAPRQSLLKRLLRSRPRLFERNVSSDQTAQPLRMSIVQLVFRLLPAWILLLIILVLAPSLPLRIAGGAIEFIRNLTSQEGQEQPPQSESVALATPPFSLELSPVFSEEVRFWEDKITQWALAYLLKPNLIATVMQIESCGDPNVASPAAAVGLFQVTAIHFQPGDEHLDPQTNAQAGLTFLSYLMELSEGDIAGSLAGYNAGERAVDAQFSDLPDETQRYVYWGSGIYEEAESGAQTSARLTEWLEAGGSALCQRASTTLGLTQP